MSKISAIWRAPFKAQEPLPDELKLNSRTVDIYAVGPGSGESILVVIGKKLVFGVDCCNALVLPRRGKGKSLLEAVCSKLPRSAVAL